MIKKISCRDCESCSTSVQAGVGILPRCHAGNIEAELMQELGFYLQGSGRYFMLTEVADELPNTIEEADEYLCDTEDDWGGIMDYLQSLPLVSLKAEGRVHHFITKSQVINNVCEKVGQRCPFYAEKVIDDIDVVFDSMQSTMKGIDPLGAYELRDEDVLGARIENILNLGFPLY